MDVSPLNRHPGQDASTRAPVDAHATGPQPAHPGAGEASEAAAGSVGVPVADRQIAQADAETVQLIDDQRYGNVDETLVNTLGQPLNRRSPFYLGRWRGSVSWRPTGSCTCCSR